MPLTATIAPSASSAAAAATGSASRRRRGSPSRAEQPRPRPAAGQALGSAWKRRSPGSSYSARQAAHIAKPAIVVARAVVGDVADDREARAAVGAVDERVAVAAVGGVEQLAPGRRRRWRRRAATGAAAPRRRRRWRRSRSRARRVGASSAVVDRLDRGQRRRLGLEPREERRRPGRVALDLELRPLRRRCARSRQLQLVREPEDEGPEADPLHGARSADRRAPPSNRAGGQAGPHA